ncbi:type II toxin-antitoxin system HicA family toxin [bacterium]|nr:type II toxin-antitoxin system HicA family toxin [bacterium]
MKGNEFIKRVRKYARANGISFEWHPEMGRGSHGVLILGNHRTVVRNPKDELKTGTLSSMFNQLDLKKEDI